MPRYDYRCQPCDLIFEVTRGLADPSPIACPECGEDAKRVFSPVGVVFKGSGFHNTDYKPRPKEDGQTTSGAKDEDASTGSAGPKETASACPAAESGSCSSCEAATD